MWIVGNDHNDLIKKTGGSFDDIEVPIGDGIKCSRINRRSHFNNSLCIMKWHNAQTVAVLKKSFDVFQNQYLEYHAQ